MVAKVRAGQVRSLQAQRGVSLSGLIVVLAVLGVLGITAMKVFPSVMEYIAIKKAISSAKLTDETVRAVQSTFDKNAEINDITAITGKDLIISKETGVTEVAFSYQKQIPLFGNVSLLIDYSGTTDPKGVIPEKSDKDAPAH